MGEDVLKRIHVAFYELYDQKNNKGDESIDTAKTPEEENGKVPDLKHVMPYVRKKILKGVNVLFSGVIPRNVIPERHKILRAALALGAKVHKHLVTSGDDKTTHVVAARLGTEKVLHAQRKGIHVVIPHWLWSCSERWERVDERVFELTKETEIQLDDVRARSGRSSPTVLPPQVGKESKPPKRKVNPGEEKPEGISVDIYDQKTGTKLNYRPGKRPKLDKGEPSSDVSSMEFDQVFDEEEEDGDKEPVSADKAKTKDAQAGDADGDDDTQFADSFNPFMRFSRGDIDNMDKEVADLVSSDDDDNDSDKEEEKLRELVLHGSPDIDDENAEGQEENTRDNDNDNLMREEDVLSDDEDEEDYQESIGSVDEDMAAALEQEFLGKQFIAFSSKNEHGKTD